MSGIEWTDRTWNPIVGCSVVSPGCTNCYAMKMAARIEAMSPGLRAYQGLTQPSKAGPVWTGEVAFASGDRSTEPLRRKKPTKYFVNSMSDLFHEDVPDVWIDRVFAVMALAPQHIFQVLTKRSERMRRHFAPFDRRRSDGLGKAVIELGYAGPLEALRWPLPNVWLGVSAEPLLGPVDFRRIEIVPDRLDDKGRLKRCGIRINALTGRSVESGMPYHSDWNGEGDPPNTPPPRLDWVIVGGESGPHARPMHPDWARGLRGQCASAGVAFFFKQWGEWHPRSEARHAGLISDQIQDFRDGMLTQRAGKRRAGRTLDGSTHDAFPEAREDS